MKQMNRMSVAFLMSACVFSTTAALGVDLSIKTEPYITSGLFTDVVLPPEGTLLRVTVRATLSGDLSVDPRARIAVFAPNGRVVSETVITLKRGEGVAEGVWTWLTGPSGLYTLEAKLDHDGRIAEDNEQNNTAQLDLPVVVQGRTLNFAWSGYEIYKGVWPARRWGTCAGSVPESSRELFRERGILALELNATGDARAETPGQVSAVWHTGAVRKELVDPYRQTAKLVLLKATIPQKPGTRDSTHFWADHRAVIDSALQENIVLPNRRNGAFTLIAPDLSARPPYLESGILEDYVRRVRRHCPEMAGMAWFNSTDPKLSIEPQTEAHFRYLLKEIDRLHLDYFIKPCLTLPIYDGLEEREKGIWLGQATDGHYIVSTALRNIGAIGSQVVTVELLVDGTVVRQLRARGVPARANGAIYGQVVLRDRIKLTPGEHDVQIRIVEAEGATLLDAEAHELVVVP